MQSRSFNPFLEDFLPAFSRPQFALQVRSTIQVGFEARLPALCFFFSLSEVSWDWTQKAEG